MQFPLTVFIAALGCLLFVTSDTLAILADIGVSHQVTVMDPSRSRPRPTPTPTPTTSDEARTKASPAEAHITRVNQTVEGMSSNPTASSKPLQPSSRANPPAQRQTTSNPTVPSRRLRPSSQANQSAQEQTSSDAKFGASSRASDSRVGPLGSQPGASAGPATRSALGSLSGRPDPRLPIGRPFAVGTSLPLPQTLTRELPIRTPSFPVSRGATRPPGPLALPPSAGVWPPSRNADGQRQRSLTYVDIPPENPTRGAIISAKGRLQGLYILYLEVGCNERIIPRREHGQRMNDIWNRMRAEEDHISLWERQLGVFESPRITDVPFRMLEENKDNPSTPTGQTGVLSRGLCCMGVTSQHNQ